MASRCAHAVGVGEQTSNAKGSDCVLAPPTGILVLLYWYTRLTSAGIHGSATVTLAIVALLDHGRRIWRTYDGNSPDQYLLALVFFFVAVDALQSALMASVVLPFDIQFTGFRLRISRSQSTKRERDTRRAEAYIEWRTRGIVRHRCSLLTRDAHHLHRVPYRLHIL